MSALLLADRVRKWSRVSETRAAAILEASKIDDIYETVVYALTDEEGKAFYVGCCKQGLGYRLVRHIYFAASGKAWKVSAWLRQQEFNVRVVVLERSPTNPREAEFRWVRYLREAGAPLTNHTGMPPSAYHRARIVEANHRRWARVRGGG